ncbi:MAG: non-canonical purine NTP pyrophosphatase [Opitutia bacterium Tous-C1TDCM]|nr:MAG: non-canonical purine NTP pyrophosphatase [Opitutae bacterium Tous-C1TDCM]
MKIYLASGNAHKAAELGTLAAASGVAVSIHSAREVGGMPAVDEDTGTFIGNARKKAVALLPLLPPGAWALADDSGVCVDALDGGPGVESAYFAGPQGDARANLLKLRDAMRGVPAELRGAKFYCLLLLRGPAGEEFVFEGACTGRLLEEPKGGSGFGYDPLFVPDGFAESYAELGDEVKNRISHRAHAWTALAAWLKGRPLDNGRPVES